MQTIFVKTIVAQPRPRLSTLIDAVGRTTYLVTCGSEEGETFATRAAAEEQVADWTYDDGEMNWQGHPVGATVVTYIGPRDAIFATPSFSTRLFI